MAAPNGRNFQVSGLEVRGHGWVEAAINCMTWQLFPLLDESGTASTETHAKKRLARAQNDTNVGSLACRDYRTRAPRSLISSFPPLFSALFPLS